MAIHKDQCERFIPTLIDHYAAHEPDKIWAVQPVDQHDMSLGFEDITYHKLASIINHAAWWLQETLPNTGKTSETIAYAGPRDIRYTVMCVAALKAGKRLLVCSLFARPAAQAHLLKLSECSTYFYAPSMAEVVHQATDGIPGIKTIEVPDLTEWTSSPARNFPYTKTFAEAKDDEWLYFHTSGTTGQPKLIKFTVGNFHIVDLWDDMPDLLPGETSIHDLYTNRRLFIAIPNLHLVGMLFSLQMTVLLGTELVLGPDTLVPQPPQIMQLLTKSGAHGTVMPPSMIDDICREPGGLEVLRNLETVGFTGAPLARQTAMQLVDHTWVVPLMGSTEGGPTWLGLSGKEDWEYYRFRVTNGADFDPREDGLYELVYRRKPEYARYQNIFNVRPDLDEYATHDLWTPHPTRPDTWKFVGRSDDMVQFAFGEELFATSMEEVIQEHPKVRGALIGGAGRMKPFLLIDLVDPPAHADKREEKILHDIWPYIERANSQVQESVKLTRELILFTDAERPLPLTIKQTVLRRPGLALYEADIEKLYAAGNP